MTKEEMTQRRSRSVLRGLFFFWPVVENMDDVERVGLFNYQACLATGFANLVEGSKLILFAPDGFHRSVSIVMLAATLCFFFLGAGAVRRQNVPASMLLAIFAILESVAGYFLDGHISWLSALFTVIFLIVLRGTILAARWRPVAGNKEAPLNLRWPLQGSRLLGRAVTDSWPHVLWPRLSIFFWISGAVVEASSLFPLSWTWSIW